MERHPVGDTTVTVCTACHGWWLPRGALAQLNRRYRGVGVSIRLDEPAFYTRASRKAAASAQAAAPGHVRHPADAGWSGVWVWALIGVVALMIGGIMLWSGIRQSLPGAQWVRRPDEGFFYLVGGLLGGVGLFGYGFVLNRKKRLIESIPTSSVRSLAVGLVEVAGAAQPIDVLLEAPFSRTPCVLYSYRVEERQGSGKNQRWVTIAKGVSEQPFSVQDETGAVMVVPFDAELVVREDRSYRTNWLGSLPPEAEAGLTRLGISTSSWGISNPMRCRESYILPGEAIYVLGTAQDNPMGQASFDNAARLYLGSSRDEPFIISDRSEKELLSQLGWTTMAMLYGGPALTVASVFAILKFYLVTGP
jgi:Zn-finger nucleic acid-binding protein